MGDINRLLDGVYEPVYQGITDYADYHYTVLGGYIELADAALGQASAAIEDHLFSGFPERLKRIESTLDAGFEDAFLIALQEELQEYIRSDVPLRHPLRREIKGALDRVVRVTVPVAKAKGPSPNAKKAVSSISALIAKKVATKAATKGVAKGVAKGASSILGGLGIGAAAGSWLGPPGAVVGGFNWRGGYLDRR